jgi:quercetin dioxygenase-like cupin family protein
MTLVYWRAEVGACLPAHAHHHEQVVSVLEGRLELSISGGETSVLGPGEIAVIPGNTEHAGRAVSACRFLDVCYPVREGYAAGE